MILPLVTRRFRIIDRVDYGGTLIHMVLQDVVGNFRADRRRDVRCLRMLFGLERLLLKLRVLRSDFTVIVARPG